MLSKYYDIIFPVSPKQVEFVKGYAGKEVLDMAAGTGGLALTLFDTVVLFRKFTCSSKLSSRGCKCF